MKVLETKQPVAIKNILFATDFEVSAGRALPFAVALVEHFHADLYVAHVVPSEAYAYAHPESVERILKETRDYAEHALRQLIQPLKHHIARCEMLLGEGDVAATLTELARQCSADLIVVGTSSRAGLGKMILGSVAEKVIREAPCPVLTIGSGVTAHAPAGIHSIVYATDFSPVSLLAAELAVSLAHQYQASLILIHVLEGAFPHSPHVAIPGAEQRLRDTIPPEPDLRYEPELLVEIGPVAERILSAAADFWADLIVMGVRGRGASDHATSHFGSIAHEVISRAMCPVLTVGAVTKL